MKAQIPIYLYQSVEPYGMIQYNIFITNISIHWFEFWKITTTHGWYLMFEDDKGVISGKSKEKLWPKEKNTKEQTMIYKTLHRKVKIEQQEFPLKTGGEFDQVLRNQKQFLLHLWHPSCHSSYKYGDKSWMKKGPNCDYDKRNISVVICETDIT
jgi:hypothetical protein